MLIGSTWEPHRGIAVAAPEPRRRSPSAGRQGRWIAIQAGRHWNCLWLRRLGLANSVFRLLPWFGVLWIWVAAHDGMKKQRLRQPSQKLRCAVAGSVSIFCWLCESETLEDLGIPAVQGEGEQTVAYFRPGDLCRSDNDYGRGIVCCSTFSSSRKVTVIRCVPAGTTFSSAGSKFLPRR
jgi:hypothetical protein